MAILLSSLIEFVMSDPRVRDLMHKYGVNVGEYSRLLLEIPPIPIETFADFQHQYDHIVAEFGCRLSPRERLALVDQKHIIMAVILDVFNKIVV